MVRLTRRFAGAILLLLAGSQIYAQAVPARLRGTSPNQSPAGSATAFAAPTTPSVAPSLLQQPAREAQIVFAGDTLSIRADNSSLTRILHDFSARSGMQVEGLGSDERVFGTFGPGTPADVLADLLNGTAYNLVLVGDQSNGAPRELILTPTTRTGGASPAVPSQTAQVNPDEAPSNEQEAADAQDAPPPTPPPPGAAPGTGTRTPQQLFEQLQRMRQAQQSSQPTQQDAPMGPQQ